MDYETGATTTPGIHVDTQRTVTCCSRLDGDLQGTSAAHLIQCLLVVVELEYIGDLECGLEKKTWESIETRIYHSLGSNLPALEVFDGSWEAVSL